MLHAKLLRSPLPHAKILNVDTRRAERLPGVKAVITRKDTPYVFGVSHFDQTPLQTEKVRHVGDAVAAVAAIDVDIVEEALRLIKVDYEPLPAVFDAVEAMKPGAPIIHEGKDRNIAAHASYDLGDVEEAFQKSDHVFEDHFETQRVAHVCPEPHNCIAVWDSSGKLTFYYCSQAPDLTRLQLAKAFGIPESKVRVFTHNVGGGFGSRATSKFSPGALRIPQVGTGNPASAADRSVFITVDGVQSLQDVPESHFEVQSLDALSLYGGMVDASRGLFQAVFKRRGEPGAFVSRGIFCGLGRDPDAYAASRDVRGMRARLGGRCRYSSL